MTQPTTPTADTLRAALVAMLPAAAHDSITERRLADIAREYAERGLAETAETTHQLYCWVRGLITEAELLESLEAIAIVQAATVPAADAAPTFTARRAFAGMIVRCESGLRVQLRDYLGGDRWIAAVDEDRDFGKLITVSQAEEAPAAEAAQIEAEDAEIAAALAEVESEACPGCGAMPGDGLTASCDHPEGCGFWRAEEEPVNLEDLGDQILAEEAALLTADPIDGEPATPETPELAAADAAETAHYETCAHCYNGFLCPVGVQLIEAKRTAAMKAWRAGEPSLVDRLLDLYHWRKAWRAGEPSLVDRLLDLYHWRKAGRPAAEEEEPAAEPETVRCYLCAAPELRMDDANASQWPERRIVRSRLINSADPTMAYALECGHTII